MEEVLKNDIVNELVETLTAEHALLVEALSAFPTTKTAPHDPVTCTTCRLVAQGRAMAT